LDIIIYQIYIKAKEDIKMNVVATRRVDELGRIVLPAELREKYGIEAGAMFEICTNGNGEIILRKSQRCCVFCKSTDELTEVMGKSICNSCKQIIKLDERKEKAKTAEYEPLYVVSLKVAE
jgi:transcriptional pleiotropic regulator of transition state genes